MKKLFLFTFLITIIQNNSYSQEGWILQYGTPTSDFTRVFMIDSLNGWVLGFDSVFNTSDGGNNWIYKNIGIGGAFTDIYFINIQTGWLSGITYVRKTTDYGENWSPPYYFGVGFTKLFFVDVNTGFVAAYGTCWRTTNGGVNWTNLNLGSGVSFFSIDFVNHDTGWIGGANGVLFKTSNCGINWMQKTTGVDTRFYGLSFASVDTGWAGGFNNFGDSKILFTSNGGENWSIRYVDPVNQGVWDIFFVSTQEGWAVGSSGKIIHTTNTGSAWELQNSGVTGIHLQSVFFVTPRIGWTVGEAGGANGKILKTTTGGIVPVINNSNEIPKDFKLFQNYPNPFNPSTEIRFSLPKDEFVTIKVYNLLGEEVKTLVDHMYKETGNYSVTFDGSNLSSGVYIYRIEAGTFKATKKMVLMK